MTQKIIYNPLSLYLGLLYMFNCRKNRGKKLFIKRKKTLYSLLTASLLESVLQRSGEYV